MTDLIEILTPTIGPAAIAILAFVYIIRQRRNGEPANPHTDHELLIQLQASLEAIEKRLEDIWNEVRRAE